MKTQTLEREYDVLDKKIPEKQSQSCSDEDYYVAIKKLGLTKNWLSLFLLFDKILKHKKPELLCLHIAEAVQKEKELKKIQQKNTFIKVKSPYFLSSEYFEKAESIYYEKTKDLKSLFASDKDMIKQTNQRNYSPDEIRKYFKNNYGLEVSENPTEEEGREMLGIIMKEMVVSTNSINSKQDSILSKLEAGIKRIDELQKNWK